MNLEPGMRVRYTDAVKRDVDPKERNDVGRVKSVRMRDDGPEVYVEWSSGWTLWELAESLVAVK